MANGSDGRSTAGPEAVGRLDGRRLGRAAAKPATSAPSSGLAGGLPPRPPRTADIRHGRVRVLGDPNPPLFLWLRKTRIGSGDDLNVAWTSIGHRTADPATAWEFLATVHLVPHPESFLSSCSTRTGSVLIGGLGERPDERCLKWPSAGTRP